MEKKSGEAYSYWKRPGLRWLLPAAAALQLVSLWMRVGELRDVAGVAERLMSPELGRNTWPRRASNAPSPAFWPFSFWGPGFWASL